MEPSDFPGNYSNGGFIPQAQAERNTSTTKPPVVSGQVQVVLPHPTNQSGFYTDLVKRIYLCGPISGLSYLETAAYHQGVAAMFPSWMEPVSPMRGKYHMAGVTKFSPVCDGAVYEHPLCTQKGIVTRDYNDVIKADAILANFLGARQVSIGSMFELAWAYDHRIPIVVVMEPAGNPHDHGFVKEVAGFIVPSLEQAVQTLVDVVRSGV